MTSSAFDLRAFRICSLRFVALGVVCGGVGCYPPRPIGDYTEYRRAEDLAPNRPIEAKATLELGGVSVPVTVKTQQSGSQFDVLMISSGATCETERYQTQSDSFSLVQAARETYDPPIPLLTFPLRIGTTVQWHGTMSGGGTRNRVRATIVTSLDRQYVANAPVEAVKVQVELAIEKSDGREATRELTLWFGKDLGLFRRKFGIGSERKAVGQ